MSELFNELAPLEATHDLAIIVFKKNIFNKSQITTISTTAPSVGAPVAMIGFGITSNGGDEFYELSQKKMELESKWNKKSVSLESYIDEYEEIESGFNRLINGASSTSGVKRWGRNTIHSCSQDLIEIAGVQESSISEKEISLFGYKLWSYLSSSPDGKRASPNHGDSGGPLFLILKESLDPDGKLFPSEVTQIGTVSYGELATDRLHLKKTSYNSLYSTTSRAFLERVNHSRGLGLKLN